MTSKRVLITGAAGYLGSRLTRALQRVPDVAVVVATDLRNARTFTAGTVYELLDVTDARRVEGLIADYRIDTIVHLAADGGQWGGDAYQVDVEGTRIVAEAALARGVRRLIVASADDVYGFVPRPATPVREDTPAHVGDAHLDTHHTGLVEQLLAEIHDKEPDLAQVVLRFAPVVGPEALNGLITLLTQPELVLDPSTESHLSFVDVEDAVGALVHAVECEATGTFNVSGDGSVALADAARRLGTPVFEGDTRRIDRHLRRAARRGSFAIDPDLLPLLWHRPVLSNGALKVALGYRPQRTAEQAFESWAAGERA